MKLNRISPDWLEVLIYASFVVLLALVALFLILLQIFTEKDIIICQGAW